MRGLVVVVGFLFLIFVTECKPDDIQPFASLVKIYFTPTPNDTIENVRFEVRKLFYAKILYFRSDIKDSAYAQTKPQFYINLDSSYNNGLTRIDSSYIPSGLYKSLSFVYVRPTADSLKADSVKSLFEIAGYIHSTPFLFRSATKFSLSFPDSALVIPRGKVINLMLNIDLNKALNPQLGGVDISTAVDGNNDGYILIEPSNIDGNGTLAAQILLSIVKNASIKVSN